MVFRGELLLPLRLVMRLPPGLAALRPMELVMRLITGFVMWRQAGPRGLA